MLNLEQSRDRKLEGLTEVASCHCQIFDNGFFCQKSKKLNNWEGNK